MSDCSTIVRDAASRFFDNYLECLSIPGMQRRWYVK